MGELRGRAHRCADGRAADHPSAAALAAARRGAGLAARRPCAVGSYAGAPKHPDWYRNLVANPAVTVEADGAEYAATATPAKGADRDELFARIVAQYPFFADHQKGVERTIPVVELTPVE